MGINETQFVAREGVLLWSFVVAMCDTDREPARREFGWRTTWRPMGVGPPRVVLRSPPARTEMDMAVYVVTLCALCVASSLAAKIPLEQTLGQAFLVSWFALDTTLFETNGFCSFKILWDWVVFGAGASTSLLLFWWLADDGAFLTAQAVLGGLLAAFWVLTEKSTARGWRVGGFRGVAQRGCVRILALYGAATFLGFLVCQMDEVRERGVVFKIFPWYVSFVLLALGIARREVNWRTRFLFAYCWGVLVHDLSRLRLNFAHYYFEKKEH